MYAFNGNSEGTSRSLGKTYEYNEMAGEAVKTNLEAEQLCFRQSCKESEGDEAEPSNCAAFEMSQHFVRVLLNASFPCCTIVHFPQWGAFSYSVLSPGCLDFRVYSASAIRILPDCAGLAA